MLALSPGRSRRVPARAMAGLDQSRGMLLSTTWLMNITSFPASLPGNFTSLVEGSTSPPPNRNFLPRLGNTFTFFCSSAGRLAW